MQRSWPSEEKRRKSRRRTTKTNDAAAAVVAGVGVVGDGGDETTNARDSAVKSPDEESWTTRRRRRGVDSGFRFRPSSAKRENEGREKVFAESSAQDDGQMKKGRGEGESDEETRRRGVKDLLWPLQPSPSLPTSPPP
jgi:hypothetical protein